jgi:hypothetical protein
MRSTRISTRRVVRPRHARPSRVQVLQLLSVTGLLMLLFAPMIPNGMARGTHKGQEIGQAAVEKLHKRRPHPTSSIASTTTVVPTTSTTSLKTTTTTSQPASTAPVDSGSGVVHLTWAPPALVNPVTYRVSGTPGMITAGAGQDSVVKFVGPVNRRLILRGGRNWVIIGGEINIDRPWTNLDDRNAILVKDATGVVHIEGVLMHGSYINDGIKTCSRDATLQIQNSRIIDLLGTQFGYHSDVIQPYCGFRELRVDALTGYSQFQGQMFKADWGRWRTTTLKRVNLVGIAPQSGYPINVVMGCCNRDGNRYVDGPVRLEDVYIKPDTSHNGGSLSGNITPSTSFVFGRDLTTGREYAEPRDGIVPQVTGRIWKGGPPLGDYVPSGIAGMGYIPLTYTQ